jgi:hypothetical protein
MGLVQLLSRQLTPEQAKFTGVVRFAGVTDCINVVGFKVDVELLRVAEFT